jgi:hypothetical protein
MKTIFDEKEAKIRLEEEKRAGSNAMPIVLWFVAIIFVGGVVGIFRWAANRPALQPPPPPVSLTDIKQTSAAFSAFNKLVQDDKWGDAEQLLSSAALQYLRDQNKSLRESVLGDRKDQKVMEAASTPSGDRTENKVTQDFAYKFYDGQFKIISLSLVIETRIENGEEKKKIVIDSWQDDGPENKPAVAQ